ncbi:MAG: glucose 1-dehydrogenase [Acidiferrobacterales bacterium]
MAAGAPGVVVTGGGQGIGKAIAHQLLTSGYRVVIAELDGEAGSETAAELGSLGDIHFIETDVGDEPSVRHTLAQAIGRFGRLDALVNNAGFGINRPIDELTLEEWNRVITVNLTGAFLCARHAAPALRRYAGAIVNIASTRALMSEPGTEAYSASKGGLLALTHALAISLGPQVRVNCVSPGWIDVSGLKKRSQRQRATLNESDGLQHPVGRVGTPQDIATLVAYLLSKDAGFITGQNFVVDGGITRKMIYT